MEGFCSQNVSTYKVFVFFDLSVVSRFNLYARLNQRWCRMIRDLSTDTKESQAQLHNNEKSTPQTFLCTLHAYLDCLSQSQKLRLQF